MVRALTRFILVFIFLPVGFASAEKPGIYYILDGSGSMWGRVDGKPKITAAKKVMNELIAGMPSSLEAGVTAYGHRRKGDCSDIEELIPMSSGNRDGAQQAIERLSPKGKTPISDSIVATAAKLKSRESETTIILVSDGIETCKKDPCAVTRELKESGARFKMHVVGFGIKENDIEQLSCIAQAGGGRFFQSSSADDLLKTLTTVQESVVAGAELAAAPEPEPEPEPTRVVQEVKKKTKSIRIKAAGPGRIKFEHESWLKKPAFWELQDPETGENKGRFKGLEEQVVSPGTYQLVWRHVEHGSKNVTLGEVFTIESGKTTVVPVKTSVQLVLPDWVEKPYYWRLKDSSTGDIVAHFRVLDQVLVPSGTYELIWRQDEHRARGVSFGAITIEPDKTNRVELLTSMKLVRADWVPEKVFSWGLQPVDDSKTWVARFYRTFEPQLVPPGKYRLVYDQDDHQSSNSDLGIVEITAGVLNDVELNTGVQIVPQEGMEVPHFIKFIELDEQGNETRTVKLSKRFTPMVLKPGTYKITYRQKDHGGSTMTIVESFELPKENLVEVEL